jgi:hypothetical protein
MKMSTGSKGKFLFHQLPAVKWDRWWHNLMLIFTAHLAIAC